MMKKFSVNSSVADPDPVESVIFGLQGSGSGSVIYTGSGSRSFIQKNGGFLDETQEKISTKIFLVNIEV